MISFPSDPISFLAPVSPLPWAMSAVDLRLIHHWSTFTWNSLGVGRPAFDKTMQVDLPVLAFDHRYLLSGVLGLASMHMQTLLPDPTVVRNQTAVYRARAFKEFREALTKMDLQDVDAFGSALLMSISLVVLCSKDSTDEDGLTVVNWVLLYRGLASVIMMRSYEEVDNTKAAPVLIRQLNDIRIPLVVPSVLVDMVASIDSTDPDFEGLEHYCNALDCTATILASVLQDGLGPALYTRLVSWPSHLGPVFATFAKEKRPRAMVVLAWYLSVLKLLDHVWWVKGTPDRDIKIISKMLGPRWAPYLETPLRVTEATDQLEIVSILLDDGITSPIGFAQQSSQDFTLESLVD
jgi:hypothetical protein